MLSDLRYIETETLRRDHIAPVEILLATEGVENAEYLLTPADSQIRMGAPYYTTLSTEGGKKAALLLDFGSEIVGGVRLFSLESSQRAGTRIRLSFGESAAEAMTPLGEKGTSCDHAIRDMEVTLPWNGMNAFGYTGFRFVYIEVLDKECWLRLSGLQGVCLYRDIPYLGTFHSSDPILDRIYEVCAYTVHLNMQHLIWDGIKRDRAVWIGDMHPEMLTIRTVFGQQKILDDSLRFVAKNYPLPQWPNGMATYGLWYLFILSDWYLHGGSDELITELADYWKPLLSQWLDLIHDEGEALIEEEIKSGFFLDWPTRYHEEARAGIYGLICLTLDACQRLCKSVKDITLSDRCKHKRAVLEKSSFKIGDKKQVTAMLWLSGLIRDKKAIAEALSKQGGHGMSTFQSYYILKATAEAADTQTALDMLREYYGGMLQVGATTFWEDFDLDWLQDGAHLKNLPIDGQYDIHGDNGRFCYVGFRHSLCHGWSGGPSAFLAENVLGIRILEAGCRKLAIQPHLGDLEWASGTYPTPYGIVSVSAKKVDGQIVVEVDAPKEIEIVQ
ncbi:MAG: alpha-L-rhamnosidase [Clostridia bacterium]|nr:alpha-L-rhamnosidase [Clostridia bacterium]